MGHAIVVQSLTLLAWSKKHPSPFQGPTWLLVIYQVHTKSKPGARHLE